MPYMLTGSLASSMYGVPRATNDIDIVVAPTHKQLEAFLQLIQRLNLYVAREEAAAALKNKTMFSVIDFANGWKVDFIMQKGHAFGIEEFERRETHEVDGIRLSIATPEDVLLAKLEWARMSESERQLEDVAGILRTQGQKLDLSYVRSWVETLGLNAQWEAAQTRAM